MCTYTGYYNMEMGEGADIHRLEYKKEYITYFHLFTYLQRAEIINPHLPRSGYPTRYDYRG